MWPEIFAGVYFCGLAIFCVLRELIFAIRTDWFFLLGINFCDFHKVTSIILYDHSVFLCSEFKSENIYSEVNFCGKNVCDNFYLRKLIFADRWKNCRNRKNWNPQKLRATR